ncbi:MAG: 3-oxoacyl-ACP synthase [Bernardetiaceae bacterium]|jgi:hypothetical protein|nr:3-oxoacyl-ACP synthase [Bernardetiaceae bacterium]
MPTPDPLAIKAGLLALCTDYVAQRLATVQAAMAAAQAAANEEGKSSAGDKYETGRAMMQLERDLHARQLAEAQKLRQELAQLEATQLHATAQAGSVVVTDRERYFLGLGAGRLEWAGQSYLAVSLASPVGAKLRGLRPGDSLALPQGRAVVVEVF